MKRIGVSETIATQEHIVVASAFFVLVTAVPSNAHHSISRHYHRNQSVTLEGIVTEVVFQNPHASIHLEVQDDSEEATVWILEWDDISDLRRQDVSSDTIRIGDEVIITGNPAREATNSLYIKTIYRPADGLKYFDD